MNSIHVGFGLMFLEIRHLRSLQAIHDTGSLSLAAERLHLTQSALSHQIKSIEHHFDVLLYLRKHKPLQLTAAGQQLLSLSKQVLPMMNNAEAHLRQLAGGETGRLHIALECHSCFEWLMPKLDLYRQQWPDVEVDIRLSMSFDPLPALSRGEIDLVITSDQKKLDGIVYKKLFDFEARAVVHNDHPHCTKKYLSAEDFKTETLLIYPVEQQRLDVFTQLLNPASIVPKQVRQVELTLMILQLVASHRGIAVLPDWLLQNFVQRNYISSIKIGKQGMKGTLFAAMRELDSEAAYMQAFLQMSSVRPNL